MPIPQEDLDRIAERADIVDIIGGYVKLEKKGNSFWGLSPFKSEKTPSFSVNAEKGMYYCFSTQQGGNVFTFVMHAEHMTFPEAVEFVAARYGIKYNNGRNKKNSAEDSAYKILLELYMRVAKSLHHLLLHNNQATPSREYLHSRGISHATINEFMLGYCPHDGQWLWNFLDKKGYSASILEKSGLFHAKYRTRALFAGRIMFPITNRRDDVIAFGARAYDGAPPKYINTSETVLFKKRNELFGKLHTLMRASTYNSVYIVEGYMDVLALHQLGVPNVVATLGTGFSAEQGRALQRVAKSAVLLFDGDTAGINATFRTARILQEVGLEAQVCQLDPNTDPAEMLQSNTSFKEDCATMLSQRTKNIIDYMLEMRFPHGKIENNTQSEHALRDIFEYVSLMRTSTRQTLSLQQVADYLNIDRDTVIQDFNTYTHTRTHVNEHDSTSPHKRNTAHIFEIECMIASICCPQKFKYLRAIVDDRCFENKAAKYLFELQERAHKKNMAISRSIIDMIEHARLKEYAIRRVAELTDINCEHTIIHIAHRLKKRYLIRSRNQQIALLRLLEKGDSIDRHQNIEDIQMEIVYLNKEILKQ